MLKFIIFFHQLSPLLQIYRWFSHLYLQEILYRLLKVKAINLWQTTILLVYTRQKTDQILQSDLLDVILFVVSEGGLQLLHDFND